MSNPYGYMSIIGVALALSLSWLYFRRYSLIQPPLGVLNLGDVLIMAIAIVLIPYLDLLMPLWFTAILTSLVSLSILYMTLEQMLQKQWITWLIALLITLANIGTALQFGTTGNAFFIVNSATQIVIVVGITNLWAQSGIKARDFVILAVMVGIYDYIFTMQMTLTDDLLNHLNQLPFAPWIGWSGLGDMLFEVTFPLVMRKAFGRTAGLKAMIISLVVTAFIIVIIDMSPVYSFATMVLFAPLMALQYIFWRRWKPERTMWQYLQAESISGQAAIQT